MSAYVATSITVVTRDGRRIDITGLEVKAARRKLRRLGVARGDIKALERRVRDEEQQDRGGVAE